MSTPITILLIEDDPDAVLLIARTLEAEEGRFRFELCGRLEGGLERIAGGGIDVVLLDLGLPDERGLPTFLKVQESAPWLPVVVLSDSEDEEVAMLAVQQGAQDFVVKSSLTRQSLVQALLYAIERNGIERDLIRRQLSLVEAQRIAQVGSWEWEPESRRLRWSEELERIFGREAPSGAESYESFLERIHPGDREMFVGVIGDAITRLARFSCQVRFFRGDGAARQAHVQGEVTAACPGSPLRVYATFHDITERLVVQKVLREREFFQTIFETDLVAVQIVRIRDGICIEVNQQFVEEIGIPRTKAVGVAFEALELWADPADAGGILTTLRAGQRIRNREVRCRGQERPERTLLVSAVARDFAAEPHAVCLWHEVAKRDRPDAVPGEDVLDCETEVGQYPVADSVRDGQALRESEARYRSLFEESKDTLFFADPDGTLVNVNPAGADLFGVASVAEMRGVRLADLCLDLRHDGREMRALRREGFVRDAAMEIRRRGRESLHGLLTASLVRDPSGLVVGIRGMIRDVTLQRSLEERLLHSQKMEAVGRLAGGVAHDFNNLLTVIQTATFFGKKGLPSHHPVQDSIREIEEAGIRAAGLTRQLLAFARRQVVAPRLVDLNALILELEKLLRRLISEDVELVTLTAPDLDLVRVDPGQLEQVLANLSVNARDAMPHGGRLTIATRVAKLDRDTAASYGLSTFGRYVELSVQDTGVGIAPEVKAHLFEPFFTTKEIGKGTGLGLATCYGIITQAGGRIAVDSELGHGSVFRIFLPCSESAVKGSVEAPSPGMPRGSETVLVVEDEHAVRSMVARALRENGYTVLEAADGEQAVVTAAQSNGRGIQLLVTDVVMPQVGGFQTATQLRSLLPGVKVLFMSGYTDSFVEQDEDQAIAFLQKPFDPETLVCKVREVLDSPPCAA